MKYIIFIIFLSIAWQVSAELITIRGKSLTPAEYISLKRDVIQQVKRRNLDIEQFYTWIEMLDRECRNTIFRGKLTIDSINDKFESGC